MDAATDRGMRAAAASNKRQPLYKDCSTIAITLAVERPR